METTTEPQAILTVERSRIRPFPGQPRRHFDPDALRQLADSIEAEVGNGLLDVRYGLGQAEIGRVDK